MCIDARRDMEEKLRKERDSQKASLEAAAARSSLNIMIIRIVVIPSKSFIFIVLLRTGRRRQHLLS